MKIINYFRSVFGKKDAVAAEFNSENYSTEQSFHLTELALFTAVDFIARSLAKCEFVTVNNNRESRKAEYYLWNYSPNKHQTKIEFFTQAVAKLIFDNELLIIETADNQLLIADSFSRTEHALIDDSFSGITCRNFTYQRTFFESEVIYLQYNNFALKGLLADMCNTYEQLMLSAQERYNKAVGHKGILELENYSFGDENFAETYNKVLAKQFKAFYSNKNAVMPIFKGMKYSEPSTDAGKTTNSEINDIQKLKAEAYTIVGNALHIPPAILSGEASQLSDAMDCAIGNAIDPIANMFEQEITKKRFGANEFSKGNYLLIDTTTVRHIDAISQANNLDKSIASGVLTPAQAQKYCNMLPCSEAWAHIYYLTKNYQTITNALKGGE
ncbi:phage portal protein [Ruminococcus bromii]|jgi:HK97 family phage portal protein|nr:phage portal protein [Ruminococcus bromii]RGI71978.1 phage portal protein [Ruminococcus bromii]DAE83484.1 MAG TPA: portal protein [Caudoviricetes sp.]DAV42283.1 MAG TPA: portal protein [Caudoviricetes sp.]